MKNEKDIGLADFIEEITTYAYFTTLKPDNKKDYLFNANITFERYSDLLGSIKDLLKICLHTLYNEGSQNSGQIINPTVHLISLLEMAVQLLPCTEGEALDAMHKYVLKFDKDKKADKIPEDNKTST
ncbi:hypothetical protein [Flavobacterium sp. HJJ]|uniref:hypothetical protein n=1 Tax=Flavobacterium sp. HJJ TaxID=2783792 RepID=UPI00188A343C|nr:hypothetical protein [Flavobacterium sp. HJJ]MBF4473414.1 hypothetical protein [Flavobacterium sp. HJJ]